MSMTSESDRSPTSETWVYYACLAALMGLGEWSALALSQHTGSVVVVWFSNAVVLTFLLRAPTVRWANIALVSFAGMVVANFAAHRDLALSLASTAPNIVEVFIVASPMRWWKLDSDITRPRALVALYVLSLGPATLLAALMAAAYIHFADGAPFLQIATTWYAADALGLGVIAPLALAVRGPDLAALFRADKLLGNIALLALVVITFVIVRQSERFPAGFLIFPVALLFTYHRGLAGAALALLFSEGTIAIELATSSGYLGNVHGLLREKLMMGQAYIVALSATAMIFGSVLSERNALIKTLEEATKNALASRESAETARRTAEGANKAKSTFLANMSHELRTPLNAILGYSEIIKDGILTESCDGRCREHAGIIHRAGSHLLGLINDILDMSKIEAGKFELDIEEIDLRAIVRECCDLVRSQAGEKKVALVEAMPNRAIDISVDVRAAKQILLNLLSNAVKFTPEGGRIAVRTTAEGGFARLSVADSGIGIAAKDLSRLGIPFEQVRNSASVAHPGTGLGLALVRALAERHGGTMRIESVENVGTTVTVSLPLAEPAHLEAAV